LDLDYGKLHHQVAVSHLTTPTTELKGKLDSFGRLDLGLTGRVNDNLDVTLNTGGSLAGFFSEKNVDAVYTGVSLKFSL